MFGTKKIKRGMWGKHHSEETKKKLSLATTKYRTGRHLLEETKLKISKAHKGRKLSEERRKQISLAQIGVKRSSCSEERKRKISLANKGRKRTLEFCQRMSELGRGRIPWNKGKQTLGHPISKEVREKIGKANKGRSSWIQGKKHSIEARKKMSLATKGIARPERRGANCHLWKGGITSINRVIRASLEYRLWRESVFERDNYTCVLCHRRGGILHADHIKPFALYFELRFSLENGRTLCKECHKQTDTYLYKYRKSEIYNAA